MSKRQFSPLIRSIFRPCIRIFQNDGLLMELKTQISPYNKLNIISLNKIFSIRENSRFMANQDRICLQKKRFSAQEGIISEKNGTFPEKDAYLSFQTKAALKEKIGYFLAKHRHESTPKQAKSVKKRLLSKFFQTILPKYVLAKTGRMHQNV